MRDRGLAAKAAVPGTVLILCPGGLEHGGGIGRQMGYFLGAHPGRDQGLEYRVVDTRGPWFLGASPERKLLAGIFLIRSAIAILRARIVDTPCLLHVNITGRGSTFRKVTLLVFARGIGMRYLLHVHDPDYANDYRCRGALMQWAVRTVFRRAEAVLVLGQRDKAVLGPLLRLSGEKLTVLYNAVPDPRPTLPRNPDRRPFRLLFLGYLSDRKGVPELLHALASAPMGPMNWHLTLAGGGPLEDYRTLTANLGMADRVLLPGWLDQQAAQAACDEADILVLPSHAEGLAMAVLEGLANGLAVVTTPVGAHGEAIEEGVSGLLVKPGDTAGLAAALLQLMENNDARARIQSGGRRRFLEKFDVGPYAARLSQIHGAVLARAAAGRIGKGHPEPRRSP